MFGQFYAHTGYPGDTCGSIVIGISIKKLQLKKRKQRKQCRIPNITFFSKLYLTLVSTIVFSIVNQNSIVFYIVP